MRRMRREVTELAGARVEIAGVVVAGGAAAGARSAASRGRRPSAARHGAIALGVATVLAIAAGCSKESEAASAPKETAQASDVHAGPHVAAKNYTIDFVASECKAGAECAATIKLEALGDYHINKEYPYKFKAESASVEFLGKDAAGKNVFSKGAGDFAIDGEKVATMTVRFKAAKAGPATISGVYKMSVCSAQNCQLETQEIGIAVTVK